MQKAQINITLDAAINLADPDFSATLLETMQLVKDGSVKWHSYDEVFK